MPSRPNVLYAVAHDFRWDLDTPALSMVADDRGCRFTMAFSQAPYCAPSRNSFFTGRRSTVTNVHTFDKRDARQFAPIAPMHHEARAAWTALPHAFADANYTTYGVGITIEGFKDSAARCPGCWSDGYFLDWVDDPNVPDDDNFATFDGTVAAKAIDWLRRYDSGGGGRNTRHARGSAAGGGGSSSGANGGGRPFFLMAGFHAGHKPWPTDPHTHSKYGPAVSGYRLRRSDLHLWQKPEGTGLYTSLEQSALELREAWLPGEMTLSQFEAIRRGYMVNERRWDAAFGLLLGEVKSLGYWPSTIVAFHGDHGLSLGEYGVAGKGKLLDVDIRVPLAIRAPSMPEGGAVGRSVVELVDIYPTLCDLAGIPCPPRRTRRATEPPPLAAGVRFETAPPLDGRSLVPLLLRSGDAIGGDRRRAAEDAAEDAEGEEEGEDEPLALSAYPRCVPVAPRSSYSCNGGPASDIAVMGTTVRSRLFRLVVWSEWDKATLRPIFLGIDEHAARGDLELYAYVDGTDDTGGLPHGASLPRPNSDKDLGTEESNLVAAGLDAPLQLTTRRADRPSGRNSTTARAVCEWLYPAAAAAWPRVHPPPTPPPPAPLAPPPDCFDARLPYWCRPRVADGRCSLAYVSEHCQRSCGVCGQPPSPPTTPPAPPMPAPPPLTPPATPPPPPPRLAPEVLIAISSTWVLSLSFFAWLAWRCGGCRAAAGGKPEAGGQPALLPAGGASATPSARGGEGSTPPPVSGRADAASQKAKAKGRSEAALSRARGKHVRLATDDEEEAGVEVVAVGVAGEEYEL